MKNPDRGASDVRAIIFDLDNTLYDRDANVRSWLESVFEDAAVVEEVMDFDNSGFVTRSAFYDFVMERVEWAEEPLEVKRRFQRGVLDSVTGDPQVASMIERLAKRYHLGVLTNGETEYQLGKFRSLGLDAWFSAKDVIATHSIGRDKPDPEAFEAILSAMDREAEETLFVGDNPVNDIAGAQAKGMMTCWIRLQDL
ncbi:MAG: HAD family hydrolase, partial [Verrucomicrobiota bacterium]